MANKLDGMYVELGAKIDGLTAALTTASGRIRTFTKTANDDLSTIDKTVDRLKKSLLEYATIWAAFKVGKSIVDAGVQMQALQNRMAAATESTVVAADAMAYARDQANKLGLDFRATADGFAMFAAATLRAGLTLEETKGIFTGVSEAAAALHLSSERVGLVFTALSQMANKGKVTMEELSQQLGDSLPGALAIFAKSMGVSTAEFTKMVSQGQVLVPDLIKLGNELHNQFGERAVAAAQSSQAAFARFGNAIFDLQTQLANSGLLDVVTKSVKDLTAALNDPSIKSSLVQLASDISAVAEAGLYLVSVFAKVSSIFNALKLDPVANGFRTIAEAINPGRSQTPAVAGAPAPAANPGFTLGKISQPGASAASISAENARKRLKERVGEMMAGLNMESDPNKAQSAKAIADLNKRFLDEQNLLEKALEKKAITQQQFNEDSLKTELDYQNSMAGIRQQYREQFLTDAEAAAEGFLGVQMGYQNKSIIEQGQNFRESIAQAAQHNKAFFMLQKAASIAQALLSARESVVDAYKWGNKLGGPPLGAVFAGVAAAAQAVNIASIASTSYGTGGGESVGSSGGAGSGTAAGETSTATTTAAPSKSVTISLEGTIFDKNTVRSLIEQINDAISDGSTLRVATA